MHPQDQKQSPLPNSNGGNSDESSQTSQTIDDDEAPISLLDLALPLVQNLKLLVLGPIVTGMIVLIITFFISPIFTAKTTILPPVFQGSNSTAAALMDSLSGLGGIAGGGGGGGLLGKDPTQPYVTYLTGDTLLNNIIVQFELQKRYDQKYLETTRKALKKNLKVIGDKKSGLITIEVDDESPQFAANLANGFVAELRTFTGKLAQQEANDRRAFYEQQLKELGERPFQDAFSQQSLVSGIIRQYESAKIDQEKNGPIFMVVDKASPPELKTYPKRLLIAFLASIAAELILIGYILAKKSWLQNRNNPQTQSRLLALHSALKTSWPPSKWFPKKGLFK